MNRAITPKGIATPGQMGPVARFQIELEQGWKAARDGVRARAECMAVISHEIRTPMNAILGYSHSLENMVLPPDAQEYVRMISSSGELLLRIIDDLLSYGQFEAGKAEIRPTAFLARELLGEVRSMLAEQAASKQLWLCVNCDASIPDRLVGDELHLRRILLNLVGNAVKFTNEGGVTIALEMTERQANGVRVRFSVHDTGPGIPESKQRMIFEPFAQADAGTARHHGGLGLGLSISQRLASLMGSELQVRSMEGIGSAFYFELELPVSEETPPSKSKIEPSDRNFASRYPLSILVVDDDARNRRLLSMILKRLGYDCRQACDGRAAAEMYRAQPAQCIFMDIHMPGIDGREAAKRIRTHEDNAGLQGAFIVALTADSSPDERERSLSWGMDEHLTKPYREDLLARALAQACRRREHPESIAELAIS